MFAEGAPLRPERALWFPGRHLPLGPGLPRRRGAARGALEAVAEPPVARGPPQHRQLPRLRGEWAGATHSDGKSVASNIRSGPQGAVPVWVAGRDGCDLRTSAPPPGGQMS